LPLLSGFENRDTALWIARRQTLPKDPSQLHDSAAHGDRNRLRAVIRAQLFRDVLDLHLYRFLRNNEEIANVSIPVLAGYLS
jgi:hypothetical protein